MKELVCRKRIVLRPDNNLSPYAEPVRTFMKPLFAGTERLIISFLPNRSISFYIFCSIQVLIAEFEKVIFFWFEKLIWIVGWYVS